MKIDYHTHTNFSPDSKADPSSMIDRAIELGLETICITDHYEGRGTGTNLRSTIDNEVYVNTLLRLKADYADKINVKIGAELSLNLEHRSLFQTLVNEYPMDFIIGSNHNMPGGWPWNGKKDKGMSDKKWYETGLIETHTLIKEIKEFDVLGHLDYIVRYGNFQTKEYIVSDYTDIIGEIFKVLIEDGKGIEINASGFKYGLGFAHPHIEVLKMYKELGGEIITIGSDAHAPEHLAYNYRGVQAQLENAGFRYYTEFNKRNPKFCAIT